MNANEIKQEIKIRTYLGDIIPVKAYRLGGGEGWEYRFKGKDGEEYVLWEHGEGVLPGNRRTRLVDWLWEIKALKTLIKTRKKRYGI